MGLHCSQYPKILLFFICVTVTIIFQCNAVTDPGNMAVLQAFYKNIDNKELVGSWSGTDACGVWKGIQCQSVFVTGISMQSMGLSGKLPANFNQLGSLTTISLQKNNLYGSLPSLSGLSNLQVAYLNDNQFDGIPSDFFKDLTDLRGIYLNNNPLNKSSGWTLSNDLLGSTQLANLSLYNTSLVGAIPPFLGSLGSLQVLSLPYNYLEGTIPSSLNGTSLQVFIANSQQGKSLLGGTLDVLGSINTLTQVWLHSNNFSGEIPNALSKASGLKELLLNNNQLTGTVPQSVASLGSLANFTVDDNLLDGPIPVVGEGVYFTYQGNYFCSSKAGDKCTPEVSALLVFLRGVGYPSAIVKSWLGNDPCSGWAGVSCIDRHVSVVNLAKRSLSGYIDPAIGNLSSLTILKLNDNRLTGTIPKTLTGLKALKTLDVSNNNLNGPTPSFGPGVGFITAGNPNINNVAPASSPGGGSSSGDSGSPSGSGVNRNGESTPKKKSSSGVIIGIVVGCVVALIAAFVIVFVYKRKKKPKFIRVPTELQAAGQVTINGAGSGEAGSSLVGSNGSVVYPLWVLQKATDNFNSTNLLGKGGFGSVYEGNLEDGSKVAVKKNGS
ncbi:hypothetical protein KI387_011159 [Taxus chinensis]|uniref:Protein kinase domain-containing protein n=1 Tax=Taxus chinensis TaxID=29808 RepID=A0AA38KXG6_TAXCH|nr:hypothetical protein KI387_011159 [Taxus chinensis]